MIPNLVPTARARRLADTLIMEAAADTGTDAVLNHLDHLDPEQVYAVLSVVLDRYCHPPGRPGRPPIARAEFTPAERRAAHAAYARGERTPEVVAGAREYQRVKKRQQRKKAS